MNTNKLGIYRQTKQRRRIEQILSSTKAHPTADWIYARLKPEFPHLSLSTVYRNLRILKKQGRILELPFGHTFDRFDGNPVPHPHFVCPRCGRVLDLKIMGLENFLENSIKRSKFKIEGFNLSLHGICKDCRRRHTSR